MSKYIPSPTEMSKYIPSLTFLLSRYEAVDDEYCSIMVKALADRLAEVIL